MSEDTREARPEYMTDKVYTYEDYLQLPDEEGYHIPGARIRPRGPVEAAHSGNVDA